MLKNFSKLELSPAAVTKLTIIQAATRLDPGFVAAGGVIGNIHSCMERNAAKRQPAASVHRQHDLPCDTYCVRPHPPPPASHYVSIITAHSFGRRPCPQSGAAHCR